MSAMSDNLASSILTEYGVQVHKIERTNDSNGSLAVLYDKTWTSQNAVSVFALADIVRDAREEDRTSEDIPKKACALGWHIGGESPHILRTPFKCRGIFVRDEYRKMLSKIFDVFALDFGAQAGYVPDERIADPRLFPPHNPFMELDVKSVQEDLITGVIVTGTPGIGKTLFLLYVLALRLLAQQTTVLQFQKNEFIIFEAAGVFVCKEMEAELAFLPEHTWFLVDSNRAVAEPPISVLNACVSFSRKLIVAASPREHRFDFTSKYFVWTRWMYPFESWEFIAARYFQFRNTPPTERQLQLFFRVWGPNAREAFENASRPEVYKGKIRQNILHVPWDGLSNTIRSLSSGYFDTRFSHNTLVAKPSGDDRSDFYVEIATKSVAALIIDTFLGVERQKAQGLYRFFLGSPKARAAAGYLLEAITMVNFQEGGVWNMQAMEKSKKQGRGQPTKAAWDYIEAASVYTLLIGYKGSSVTITRDMHHSPGERNFAEVARIDFSPKETMTVEGAMYVPKYATNPAFDAWIFNPQDGNMVAIQVTCQTSPYNLHSKGFEWFDRPEVKSLDIVIVSDEGSGKKVETLTENVGKIRNVYRLKM